MESIAILLSIYTVLRYGIQRNIFFLVLIAGFCCLYIALFPNTEWSITVTMAMLGKLDNYRSSKMPNAENIVQRLNVDFIRSRQVKFEKKMNVCPSGVHENRRSHTNGHRESMLRWNASEQNYSNHFSQQTLCGLSTTIPIMSLPPSTHVRCSYKLFTECEHVLILRTNELSIASNEIRTTSFDIIDFEHLTH